MIEQNLTREDFKEMFVWRHQRPGDVFMDTLKRDGLIIAPGVYNAMGAHIAKRISEESKKSGSKTTFNAIYEGHWSTSAMLLRKPDMGFITRDFAVQNGKFTVAAAHPLPVIFDIETGFGNAITITETAKVADEMGIAVIHMEDQVDSAVARRCGNLGGKMCVEAPEMEAKIESCLMSLQALNSSVRLMVRTDALTAANGGLENAIERGKRYMSIEVEGVHPTILWADAMYNPNHIDRWIQDFRKFDPNIILGFNYSPNRDWTPKTYKDTFGQNPPTYADLYRNGEGFSVIWHTILQARADMESTWNTLKDMAENGAEALWKLHERQRKHPVGDSQAMSGVKEWQAFEQSIGRDQAIKRYDKSEGYKATKNG